jgi:hypothetical protein
MKLIDYDKYAKKWTPRRVILLLLTQALVTGLSGRNDNGRHVSPQIFGLDFHARFGILQRGWSICRQLYLRCTTVGSSPRRQQRKLQPASNSLFCTHDYAPPSYSILDSNAREIAKARYIGKPLVGSDLIS